MIRDLALPSRIGERLPALFLPRATRLLIRYLGLVTVPMTNLPPQHTIASQIVLCSPLNSFQQGSSEPVTRTFRNGHSPRWSHIVLGLYFVLPYVG
ncbi:hypothetical protein MHI01_30955 [Paenibacillus sp. FSL M7-0656]|uniref:hypothetical protein n=1 Tax=Paenibacillus sp. FSL M7-0656 TaxID=2921534 RepID=UPI0030F9ECB0